MQSNFDFSRLGRSGRMDIYWHNHEDDGQIVEMATEALSYIDELLIVADTNPNNAATFLRMIVQITREATQMGIETRVVFPNEDLFYATHATGFDRFFQAFLTEQEALSDLQAA